MKKIIVENEDLCSYLESLGYEVQARKDLLSYMVQQGVNISEPAFKEYHKEYTEFTAQYETAKNEFEKTVVTPVTGNVKAQWNLDFGSRELTIQGID